MRRKQFGCRFIVAIALLLIGAFWSFVPKALLIDENLPERYKHMAVLGDVFALLGFIIVAIAIFVIARAVIQLTRK